MVEPTYTGMNRLLSDGLVKQFLQFVLGRLLFAVEVLHHEVFVGFGNQVAEFIARGGGCIGVFFGDFFHTFRFAFEIASLHAQHVNNALEVFIDTHRNGHGAQTAAKTGMQGGHDNVEVGVFAVDVVDEHAAGKAHVFGFAPQAS